MRAISKYLLLTLGALLLSAALLLANPYGAYLFTGTIALCRQVQVFKAATLKKQAVDDHLDAVACGFLPVDDVAAGIEPANTEDPQS